MKHSLLMIVTVPQAGASILLVPNNNDFKITLISIHQKIMLAAIKVNNTLLFCKVLLFYNRHKRDACASEE